MNELLFFALVLGFSTGLRAFTPLAILCWAAYWNWIQLGTTRLAFLASLATAIIIALIALFELVNDKLPSVGNRTAPPAFAVRILLAMLCGAAIFLAAQGLWIIGAITAAIGAMIGTLGGFHLRRFLVKKNGLPDLFVAILEDFAAIGTSFLVLSHLS